MDKTDQTRHLLMQHCKAYPLLQVQDLLKFLYQSAFGCEHLLTDPQAATDYIRRESDSCLPRSGQPPEPLDGNYCRIHLDVLRDGLRPETLGKLFFLSAKTEENASALLEEKLTVLQTMAKEGDLPFTEQAVVQATEAWRTAGFSACHHSDVFRKAYSPAYRVLRKEYALFLPLFSQIDRMLQMGRVNLAIEGGSASGKTTLSELLQAVYGCTVFHMDDYFLRPHQKTPERLAQPGGNVDRERFLQEILLPLHQKQEVTYHPYDCHTRSLLSPITVLPTELTVIEGVYSMHPELTGYYDLSVFLDITPQLQEQRIQRRNSPETAKRFWEEWIPLEEEYFQAMQIKDHCNLIFPCVSIDLSL